MIENSTANLREEIEVFKEKMHKVENLIYQTNRENKELQHCFRELIKLINHKLVSSIDSSTELLKNFNEK